MRRRAVAAKIVGAVLAVLLVSGPVAEATTGARSPTGARLLVAAWPGADAAAVAATAGAEVVAVAGPAVLVADRTPDLALRLWRAGAWMVSGDPWLVALARQPRPAVSAGPARR